MASRKVYFHLDIKVIAIVDEGTEIEEVIQELDYNIIDKTGHADILDTTIEDYTIIVNKTGGNYGLDLLL
jgi:hypothetical protein